MLSLGQAIVKGDLSWLSAGWRWNLQGVERVLYRLPSTLPPDEDPDLVRLE
jgi:hypothetical protein